jgi:hypothetical protein
MAIQISNFSPVWTYIQPSWGPINNPTPQYYNGTYMFITCAINSGTSVSTAATLYSENPVSSSNAQVITNLNFGNFDTDVQGDVLLASHNYIISQSISNNPGVDFTIISLSGSVI